MKTTNVFTALARIPGYVKFAVAVILLSAATSMTSCCPPDDGGDPWGTDPGNGTGVERTH